MDLESVVTITLAQGTEIYPLGFNHNMHATLHKPAQWIGNSERGVSARLQTNSFPSCSPVWSSFKCATTIPESEFRIQKCIYYQKMLIDFLADRAMLTS